MKDKKGVTLTNAFQKILDESKRKPNKIWADKGSEFYNRSTKSWLEKNDVEMYSTHNERESFVAERFIRTLKNRIFKYIASISKNVYMDKLDDLINNHGPIKTKPIDVKSNTYIDYGKEISEKDPKFKIGDNVRISKFKIIFAKG